MRYLTSLLLCLTLPVAVGCGAKDASPGNGDDALDGADAGTDPACNAPDSQVLSIIHAGAHLKFSSQAGGTLRYGTSTDVAADAPSQWSTGDELTLPSVDAPTSLRVFAEATGTACTDARRFDHIYQVQKEYEPAAGQPLSSAIGLADRDWVGWATGYEEPVQFGSDVDDEWRNPEKALGRAEGTTLDTVSLGNGGQIVLTFDPPIKNGEGADFAVFENSFSDDFLELAFVEVSSDGEHFVRFDSAYLGDRSLGAYDTQRTEIIGALAGKYRAGFGTPFDLDLLRYRDSVQAHLVDLDHITHVRIVDIVGDGSAHDSFGHVIYDPTPTVGSGGFDLDGVGVLNAAE